MEQGTHLEDGGVSTHLVIGVGDVHGGDAQEVNEGCIVAASTQRAQPVGRKTMGLEATGPLTCPPQSQPRHLAHLGTRPYTGLL